MANQRISSFDFLKAFALLGVICLHAHSYAGVDRTAQVLIKWTAQFALPYFFIVSGYFFRRGISDSRPIGARFRHYATRLLALFLVWSLLYLVKPVLTLIRHDGLVAGYLHSLAVNWAGVQRLGWLVLLEGSYAHLWFFPALVLAFAIITGLVMVGARRLVFPVAIALYVIGLLAQPYSHTPLGIHLFYPRYGPFMSTFCVAIGYALAERPIKVSFSTGLLIFLAGNLLQAVESILLWGFGYFTLTGHAYLLTTPLLGLGLFFMAQARPQWGEGSVLVRAGRCSLGIYALHYALISSVALLVSPLPAVISEALIPPLVLAVTAVIVFGIARIPGLRFLVE